MSGVARGGVGLPAKTEAWLARMDRMRPLAIAWGMVLVSCGVGYGVWAIARFDPRAPVEKHASFDRPVSALVELYRPHQRVLDAVRPQNQQEHLLKGMIVRGTAFNVGIMITMLRIFLAILLVVKGLVTFAVIAERQRLRQVIEVLRTG